MSLSAKKKRELFAPILPKPVFYDTRSKTQKGLVTAISYRESTWAPMANYFRVHDKVAVQRHAHGWENGREGVVISVDTNEAKVRFANGQECTVDHPRDMKKT